MVPYDMREQERFEQIPERIKLLIPKNAIVHASVMRWIRGDEPLEWFLVGLIIVLVDQNNDLESKLIDQLSKAPPQKWIT